MYLKPHSSINRLAIAVLNGVSVLYKLFSLLVLKVKSWRKTRYSEACVVSIDNLSFGGTGKTALVLHLGMLLEELGFSFAVVSRGYRARYEKRGVEVTAAHTSEEVGDEAKMVKLRFPDQPVFIGKNRRRSISAALARGMQVILLDDGFQSTGIYKDLKIMLLNPAHPYYYLRHFKSLISAEDLVYTYADPQETGTETTYCFELEGFFTQSGEKLYMGDVTLLGFSALGDNHRFQQSLCQHKLVHFKGFPDHYKYSQEDLHELDRSRVDHNIDYLVCTEKDFVKIAELDIANIPLIYTRNRIKLNWQPLERFFQHAEKEGKIKSSY